MCNRVQLVCGWSVSFKYEFLLAAVQVEWEMCGKEFAELLRKLFPPWRRDQKGAQKWWDSITFPNMSCLIAQEQKRCISRSRGWVWLICLEAFPHLPCSNVKAQTKLLQDPALKSTFVIYSKMALLNVLQKCKEKHTFAFFLSALYEHFIR